MKPTGIAASNNAGACASDFNCKALLYTSTCLWCTTTFRLSNLIFGTFASRLHANFLKGLPNRNKCKICFQVGKSSTEFEVVGSMDGTVRKATSTKITKITNKINRYPILAV